MIRPGSIHHENLRELVQLYGAVAVRDATSHIVQHYVTDPNADRHSSAFQISTTKAIHPMTEEQIERSVQHKFDRLDARLLAGHLTQAQYDEEARGISKWADLASRFSAQAASFAR